MRESERERGRGSERGEREVTHIQGSNEPPTTCMCWHTAASYPILVKSLPWTTRKADVRFLTSWPERERPVHVSVRGQWLKTTLTSPSGSE